MKGSITVAKMFGIPVKIHWTFSLFILYLIYVGYSNGQDWFGTSLIILSILALFFCVLLHEYGHALTARRYGVKTQDIILSPIGGVARLERLPEKPIQEFYVAIAGPLVNIAIVILVAPFIYLWFRHEITWGIGFMDSIYGLINFSDPLSIIPFILLGNIVLAGFNLLPAFPMDGGRIFRSLLSLKVGRLRATQLASYLGNLFGLGMIAYGLYTPQLLYAFIGVFIFLMATQEYKMVKMETVLKNHTVADLYRNLFTRIYLNSKMETPIDFLKRGMEKNFLVFNEEEKLAGVLHELFIKEAMSQKDFEGPVAEYLSSSYEVLNKTDNLEFVLKKMHRFGYSILPVYEEEELIGVVDVTMMNNFMKLKR